jgi:predicted transposase YbfD/YdcC
MDIQGAVVTADALNTQTKTVEAIVGGGADYVLPVKGNHPTLYGDLQTIFDERCIDDIRNNENNSKTYTYTEEREHGETVRREYFLIPKIEGLYNADLWDGLESIGLVHKTITKIDQKTNETITVYEDRYYISSLQSITDFSRAARGHWAVESLHWHLDYTFRDDQNKTTVGNGAEGLQIFKKLALNILKIVQAVNPKPTSIKKLRFKLSLSYEDMIGDILSLLAD